MASPEDFLEQVIDSSIHIGKAVFGGPVVAQVISRETNSIIGMGYSSHMSNMDPIAHAEINAIDVARRINGRLDNHYLVSSCEPCPMCLSLVAEIGIDEVLFANSTQDTVVLAWNDNEVYMDMVKPKMQKISSSDSCVSPRNTIIHNNNKLMCISESSVYNCPDPLEYSGIRAIRSASKKFGKYYLSGFHMVSYFKPSAFVYAAAKFVGMDTISYVDDRYEECIDCVQQDEIYGLIAGKNDLVKVRQTNNQSLLDRSQKAFSDWCRRLKN